jgi:hypothetical protein
MEYAALATALIGIVTPFLKSAAGKLADKAGEKLGEKAGEAAWNEHGSIWEKMKGLFHGDEEILHIYEKYPSSDEVQKDFAKSLEEKLAAAPDTAKELNTMVEKMPASTKTNTINQSGDNNVAVTDNPGSTVNITR